MRPLIMALLAIVITTSACRKERANIDTRMPPKQVRLSKIVWDNKYHTWQYDYLYNKAGYLSEIITTQIPNGATDDYNTVTRIVYERNAANRITQQTLYDEYTETGTYFYTGGNKLPDSISYSIDGQLLYTEYFTWRNDKLIVRQSSNPEASMTSQQEMLYDDNGNLQEIKYRTYNRQHAFFRYHNIRHDNMPNYTQTIKGCIPAMLHGIPDPQRLSANNATVVEEESPPNYTNTSTYNLTYNKHNYVSKAVKNNGQETTEYYYEEIN
jgi:hypothetical protein